MKNLTVILLLLMVSISCTEEEVKSRPYPRVRTRSADVHSGSATLHGEITYYTKDKPVTDHGFILAPDPAELSGDIISLGPTSAAGKFQINIEFNPDPNNSVYFRAYVKNGEYDVLGEPVKIE